MRGYLWDASSLPRKAQHFQSVAGIGGNIVLMSASDQFLTCAVIELDFIHGVKTLHIILRICTKELRRST